MPPFSTQDLDVHLTPMDDDRCGTARQLPQPLAWCLVPGCACWGWPRHGRAGPTGASAGNGACTGHGAESARAAGAPMAKLGLIGTSLLKIMVVQKEIRRVRTQAKAAAAQSDVVSSPAGSGTPRMR